MRAPDAVVCRLLLAATTLAFRPVAAAPLATSVPSDGPPCCVPKGVYVCAGPCLVNGSAIVEFTERDTLELFGPGGVFLNYSIHNTRTSFTENEVYTRLPDGCTRWTGATMARSDVEGGQQVVLEDLFFSDDCASFTKIVRGQFRPGPVLCNVKCRLEPPAPSVPPAPDVSIDGSDKGHAGLAVAARVAARHITARSNATVGTDSPVAAVRLVLSIDTALGPEAFAILADSGPRGGVSIAGGDARGLYYGIGKLLRGSTFGAGFTASAWRGHSAPAAPNGFRAMYLATHLENFYQAAPIEQVQEYIEDLALWGANTVALVMPWEEFASFEDPTMVRQIKMMSSLYRAAQETGLGVGLVAASNQGFTTRPESIKACYPLPNDHFGEFNSGDPQVSTVKDGGVAYLLTNFGQLFQ